MTMIETPNSTLTGEYSLDPAHTQIGFIARHAMVTKVRGTFDDFVGTGYFDAEDPSKTHLELTVQVASVDTRNADRNKHLRTNDFFDAPNHPEIHFVSTAVEATDSDHYRVTGDLSIKGVTKSVSVDFEFTGAARDTYGNDRVGFEGSTVVNRKDWGVNFNAPLEAGGVLVSEKITLEFEISAIKKS